MARISQELRAILITYLYANIEIKIKRDYYVHITQVV